MVERGLPAKKLKGRPVSVGALHALIRHPRSGRPNCFDHLESGVNSLAVPGQQLVLALPADRHQLGKQLLYRLAVKVAVGHRAHRFQLLAFPLPVVHGLTRLYLVFRHIRADFHALLEQADQLAVDLVQLSSQFSQIQVLHRLSFSVNYFFLFPSRLTWK